MKKRNEPVEVVCPKCRHTEIVYIPREELPKCPKCGSQMVIREILDEGKSY
ncbi:MAG: hypothetical protein ACOWWM_04465 [Desulfobacterales bacterium]